MRGKMQKYSVYPRYRKDGVRKVDGKGEVFLSLGINGSRFRIRTGIYLKPEYWNEKTKLVKTHHPDHNDINIEIRKRVAQVNAIFDSYRRDDRILDKEIFLQEFYNPSSREDFISYMEIKIEKRYEAGEIAKSTWIKHRVVLKKLKNFKRRIPFNSISQMLIDDFDLWHARQLRKEVGSSLVNNGNGPRSNAMRIIKRYLRLAKIDDIEVTIPNIKTKQHSPEAVYLSQFQLRKLIDFYEDIHRHPEHWKEVLRCFLAMCFTGCSYVDIQSLTWQDNIKGGLLKYVRNKQKRFRKQVTVPLTPIAKKYVGARGNDLYIFKKLESQYFNRVLKEISKAAGLNIKISAKVARDTFGTIFAERTGGDAFTLMELMGHSKIETTRKYVHLSQGHKERQMHAVFSDFLTENEGT